MYAHGAQNRARGGRVEHRGRFRFGDHRFGEAEVEDLDAARLGQRDVVRLQIAVDDAFLMRGFQRVHDLPGDSQRVLESDRPARRAPAGRRGAPRDPIGQGAAFSQFEHDELRAVALRRSRTLFEAENRRDVRVIERRQHLRFASEPRDEIGVVGGSRGKGLDGDVTAQPLVAAS